MIHTNSNASRNPPRLPLPFRMILYGVGLGSWLTGVLWLAFHYFLQRQTEFGPHPHPMEFWWRAAHGLFAFAALWAMGLFSGTHVVKAWTAGRGRGSGGILLGLLVWLGVSGYLLYYLGNERLLANVRILHWGLGIIVPIPFLVHHLAAARTAASRTTTGRSGLMSESASNQ